MKISSKKLKHKTVPGEKTIHYPCRAGGLYQLEESRIQERMGEFTGHPKLRALSFYRRKERKGESKSN